MLDVPQFKELIIRPALKHIGAYSLAAEQLVLGTALQESRLMYLKQLGKGPAMGLFQMEPRTHDDLWANYLNYKRPLAEAIMSLAHRADSGSLATDLLYAAAMCRVHYLRIKAPLPEEGDIEAQAAYWKKYYNTYLGAGTEEEYLENWRAYSGSRG